MSRNFFNRLFKKLKKKKAPQGLDEYISANYINQSFYYTDVIETLPAPSIECWAKDEISEYESCAVEMPAIGSIADVNDIEDSVHESPDEHECSVFEAHAAPVHEKIRKRKKLERPCASKPTFLLDESFSDRLQHLLFEKNMTAPQCYKRACLDRKLFSKICSNKDYRPKKNTVLSLAIALQLNLDETRDFLEAAGYALSHSILSDVIVEFYISKGFYDIFEINEVLFEHDQPLLGS